MKTLDAIGVLRAKSFCIALVIAFAFLCWRGIRDKSATVDEPMQGIAAFTYVRYGAMMDLDTPMLWKYVAMIAEPQGALNVGRGTPLWELTGDTHNTWLFTRSIFVQAGPERADQFLLRARLAMIVFGIAVCAIVILWAWQIAGPVAGFVAATLICLDPNLIANAPLVKSDVPLMLSFALAGWGVWRCGRNATLPAILFTGLAAATAPVVKYSGILLPPLVCALFILRAAMPADWRVLGRDLRSATSRLGAAAAICAWCFVAFLLVTWTTYRFDPGVFPPNMPSSDLIARLAIHAADCHLVPRSWAGGLAIQRGYSTSWPAYLLGMRSNRGWWWYFPLAWLFKTPVATIAIVALATTLAATKYPALRRRMWDVAALAIPAAAYAACAMATRFNAGLRHFLVVYPFVYVAAAAVLAPRINRLRDRRIGLALLIFLATETLLATPNFLAFFNFPSRLYGPLHLLSDANVDWGQDLKLLTAWQQEHVETPLYVAYFGVSPPGFYGMRYIPLPGVPFFPDPARRWPTEPCVVAVSATILQQVYPNWGGEDFYAALRETKPIEILGGGSIYLYQYPLKN